MQPDATDWKIIEILQKGYVPNNTIARELDISEGTVRARLKKLKDAGILEVKALINPDALENKQLAIIAMRVAESRLLESKAAEVARLENVLSVSIASGRYDLIAEVLVDSNRGPRAVPHSGSLYGGGRPQLRKLPHAEKLQQIRLTRSVNPYLAQWRIQPRSDSGR